MRISVNLASKPFVELRPLFARLRLAMGVLALLALGLALGSHALAARAKIATARMDGVNDQAQHFVSLRGRNEARMMQPQNRAVLERSQFLNALFARKSFSWTAVMMDLERVLPPGVQVTSIEPVISKRGDVSIRLRVTGERDKAIQLVRNLEHSARFVAPQLRGETLVSAERARALAGVGAPGTTAGGATTGGATLRAVSDPAALTTAVEFEIVSAYNPLPEASAAEARAEVKSGRREKPNPDDSHALPDAATPAAAPGAGPVVHDRRGGAR